MTRKRRQVGWTLNGLLDAMSLRVKTHHVATSNASMVVAILEDEGMAPSIDVLRNHCGLATEWKLTVMLDRANNRVVFRRAHDESDDPTDITRASGEAVCELCAYKFREHPFSLMFALDRILCDGRRVRL